MDDITVLYLEHFDRGHWNVRDESGQVVTSGSSERNARDNAINIYGKNIMFKSYEEDYRE